jgi:hypothetical protein
MDSKIRPYDKSKKNDERGVVCPENTLMLKIAVILSGAFPHEDLIF